MKKLFSSLIMVIVAVQAWAVVAVGTTFSVGDLTYRVTSVGDSETYPRVYVTGLSSTGLSTSDLALAIPTNVTYNSTVYYVDEITSSAFKGKTNIKSVNIKYGVRAIAANAFENCTNMTWASMPSSMYFIYSKAFAGCSKLTKVYSAIADPTGRVINNDAFPSNSGMTLLVPKTNANSVHLYKKISSFSMFATVTKSEQAYDMYYNTGEYMCVTDSPAKGKSGKATLVGFNPNASKVVDGTLSLTSKNVNFGGYTFAVTAVADSACRNVTGLKKIDIAGASALTTIGTSAFAGCTALESVTLNEGLNKIGSYAFYKCSALPTIQIPASVTSVASNFVDQCTNLFSISVTSGNNYYISNSGILYNKTGSTLLRCPPAWAGTLTDDRFPSYCQEVGSQAFADCNSIINVYLPYGVKTIGYKAFSGSSVVLARIPSSVNTIGDYAFYNCTSLSDLYINVATPPTITSNTFLNCKKTKLVCPWGRSTAYKSADYWKTWSSFYVGAYDLSDKNFTSTAGKLLSTYSRYTVVSTEPQDINGTIYSGRAHLVINNSATTTSTLNVPEYITSNDGRKFAVTCFDDMGNAQPYDFKVNLGVNVDTISAQAFKNQTHLTQVGLNPNIKVIDTEAFSGCTNLASDFLLPYGTKYLGQRVFANTAVKKILIPSTCNMGFYMLDNCSKLEELYMNYIYATGKHMNVYTFTNVPTSCKLYVPTGYVKQFKEGWPHFTSVQAGAYDFTFNNAAMNSTAYHITVIKDNRTTVDGVTYDGTARYVYHPANKTIAGSTWVPSAYESFNGKRYLMTEVGDSCLVGASQVTKVDLTRMPGLTTIGHNALQGTGLTSVNIPKTVTKIGDQAFYNCTKLTDLTFLHTSYIPTLGYKIWGNNASSFTAYARWKDLRMLFEATSSWTDKNNINGYINTTTRYEDIAVFHPVDWDASGLEAYIVTGYNDTRREIYTKNVSKTPGAEGVIVGGLEANTITKLKRPTSSVPAINDNLLIGHLDERLDLYNKGYFFNSSDQTFIQPFYSGSNHVTYGDAWLDCLPKHTLAQGNTWKVTFPSSGIKGDVDGNGTVDINDANILINILLGKDTASKYSGRADVDGNGTVDVSDLNAILNIILGK